MHMRRAASQRVSRRRFLGISAAGVAAGAAGLGVRQGASAQDDGDVRVARVRCESAVVDGFPEVSACRAMIERAAQLLRGQTLPDLLASLVAPDDVVGIKVNTLAGFELATNLEVVDALIEGLLEAGVPASNIVVWDRFEHHLISCLYEIQRSEGGVRCYGGESDGAVDLDPDVFYASELGDGEPSYLYRVATQDVTKIINVPVPKDHNCSGVTGCLKNIAFGAVNNTVRFHGALEPSDIAVPAGCRLAFSLVHVGVGRGVDHESGATQGESHTHRLAIGEVQLGQIHAGRPDAEKAADFTSQSASRAGDEDAHGSSLRASTCVPTGGCPPRYLTPATRGRHAQISDFVCQTVFVSVRATMR